jgi:hypothetical protein
LPLIDDANELLSETNSTRLLAGLSVTNGYDNALRRTDLAAQYSSAPLLHYSFGFDSAGRPQAVNNGLNGAAYSYLANSPLVSHIQFTNSGAPRMTTTKHFDHLNHLTGIQSLGSHHKTNSTPQQP